VNAATQLRIEGRGPVALALRLFLARQGFAEDTIDHAVGSADPLPPALAARSLALSLGSLQLLGRIIDLPPAAPIRRVEVSFSRGRGVTSIDADDLGASRLGAVVRYGALHEALSGALAMATMPERSTAAGQGSRTNQASQTADTGPSGPTIRIRADGDPHAAARTLDFRQSALLAEIEVSRELPDVAFERFTPDGPLAILPLPEPRRHALVWCAPPAVTQRRLDLDAGAFGSELQAMAGDVLGTVRLASERFQAPLQRRRADADTDPSVVTIGNAAQTLHPVAGQGLNLGLRDAFELAQLLGDACAQGTSMHFVPTRFRCRRSIDRRLTIGITDTLARVFRLPGSAPIHSLALDLLDRAGPLRNRFARQLMFGWRGPLPPDFFAPRPSSVRTPRLFR